MEAASRHAVERRADRNDGGSASVESASIESHSVESDSSSLNSTRADSIGTEAIGVVLLNLGGPDAQEAVQPFLFNLFSDREIIQFPGGPLLQPVWARFLSFVRGPKVRRNYRSIGGGSPLLELTKRQAGALEQTLNREEAAGGRYRVRIAMRYWRPTAEEALRELDAAGVRRIVSLTLYPQFSTATTQSSINDLMRTAGRLGMLDRCRITHIDRYPEHPGYLKAVAQTVKDALREIPAEERERTTLLFSAHGLPMRFIEMGDPYVEEVRRTCDGVLGVLRSRGIDPPHRLGYQSRTGPLKWIGPQTEEVLEELAREGIRSVLVVPIAFVSDHIETLYEIDQLYGDLARRLGIHVYRRSRMLNDDPQFISALSDLLTGHLKETGV